MTRVPKRITNRTSLNGFNATSALVSEYTSWGYYSSAAWEYLWLQTLLCLVVFFAINNGPRQWANNVSIMLGFLRLSWLPFSMYLSTICPVKQYTLVFPPLYSMLHLWGETGLQTSFRNMVIFYVKFFAMFLIMLIPIRDMLSPSGLVGTSFILQRPRTSDWESNPKTGRWNPANDLIIKSFDISFDNQW